ncbi:hypothetical protein BX600DRAFT_435854 [Xylariales sp. PMI_506]|nr:hypothetical protein BX600DRAFT_435854 [Xylariales sp. PMI_506]
MSSDPCRQSINNAEEDRFHSCVASHAGSRHASITANQAHRDALAADLAPDQPLIGSVSSSCSLGTSDRDQTRATIDANSKYSWGNTHQSLEIQRGTKHNDLCSKSTLCYLGNRGSFVSKNPANICSINHFGAENIARSTTGSEHLVGSPADPILTKRWNSISLGEEKASQPCSRRLPSLDFPKAEDNKARQGIESIVRNIRSYLSYHRHDDCFLESYQPHLTVNKACIAQPHAANNGAIVEPDNHYLVSTTDIAGILDIVIAGLRQLRHDNFTTGCLSMLLPLHPIAKPSPSLRAIIPLTSSLADPATTISNVQPSFSPLSKRSSMGNQASSKATIICRQSITEIS